MCIVRSCLLQFWQFRGHPRVWLIWLAAKWHFSVMKEFSCWLPYYLDFTWVSNRIASLNKLLRQNQRRSTWKVQRNLSFQVGQTTWKLKGFGFCAIPYNEEIWRTKIEEIFHFKFSRQICPSCWMPWRVMFLYMIQNFEDCKQRLCWDVYGQLWGKRGAILGPSSQQTWQPKISLLDPKMERGSAVKGSKAVFPCFFPICFVCNTCALHATAFYHMLPIGICLVSFGRFMITYVTYDFQVSDPCRFSYAGGLSYRYTCLCPKIQILVRKKSRNSSSNKSEHRPTWFFHLYTHCACGGIFGEAGEVLSLGFQHDTKQLFLHVCQVLATCVLAWCYGLMSYWKLVQM